MDLRCSSAVTASLPLSVSSALSESTRRIWIEDVSVQKKTRRSVFFARVRFCGFGSPSHSLSLVSVDFGPPHMCSWRCRSTLVSTRNVGGVVRPWYESTGNLLQLDGSFPQKLISVSVDLGSPHLRCRPRWRQAGGHAALLSRALGESEKPLAKAGGKAMGRLEKVGVSRERMGPPQWQQFEWYLKQDHSGSPLPRPRLFISCSSSAGYFVDEAVLGLATSSTISKASRLADLE